MFSPSKKKKKRNKEVARRLQISLFHLKNIKAYSSHRYTYMYMCECIFKFREHQQNIWLKFSICMENIKCECGNIGNILRLRLICWKFFSFWVNFVYTFAASAIWTASRAETMYSMCEGIWAKSEQFRWESLSYIYITRTTQRWKGVM